MISIHCATIAVPAPYRLTQLSIIWFYAGIRYGIDCATMSKSRVNDLSILFKQRTASAAAVLVRQEGARVDGGALEACVEQRRLKVQLALCRLAARKPVGHH